MTRTSIPSCALLCALLAVLPAPPSRAATDSPRERRLAAAPPDLAASLRAQASVAPHRFAPGEVLAILREDTPLTLRADHEMRAAGPLATVLAKHGLETFDWLRGAAPTEPLHGRYLRLRSALPGFQPETAAADLRATGLFRAVIPNYNMALLATIPNDPLVGQQWHVNTVGPADIHLPEAWDLAHGTATTTIAIMDTGVDYTHPDLAAASWVNAGEIPLNGIDDDANGFVDDDRGWDFGTNDRVPLPEPAIDPTGLDVGFHGTHCAGIAAAVTNNAVGVAGASWGCKVMALKVSDSAAGISDAAITGAFLYAIDKGVDVLSMSFGGPGDPGVPEYFQALVDDATAAGILCVAAAGNDGADIPSYPAACDDVLAVGATNSSNARASFSTYGAWVDVASPGEQILSTICQNYEIDFVSQLFFILFFGWDGVSPYMLSDGTSMACPLAAGVAALVKSHAPFLSPLALRQLLIDTGDTVAYDQPIGKKINAFAALQAALAGTAVEERVAPERPAGAALSIVEIAPNPFRPRTAVRFSLTRAGAVEVTVFDLAGRRVRGLTDGELPAGLHETVWDGRDDAGHPAANGVYLVRAESAGEVTTGKVTLMR